GRTLVPNHFTVELSESDHERFAEVAESLQRELAEAAREHARDEGYVFMGPVSVHLEASESHHTGAFSITGRMREGKGGLGAGSLVLPTGERLALGEAVVTVGRRNDSTLQMADPNVSRDHAEIRPNGTSWLLVDLGSTNGSRVNGARVSSQELREGDEIAFGNTVLRFEAS
ncbi:MAG: FhaA domain-containing protein, partial [Acidimicrobiales bacterium]